MCERIKFLSIYSFSLELNKQGKFTESRNTSTLLPVCLKLFGGSGRIEADCEGSKRKGAINRIEREAIISSLEVLWCTALTNQSKRARPLTCFALSVNVCVLTESNLLLLLQRQKCISNSESWRVFASMYSVYLFGCVI